MEKFFEQPLKKPLDAVRKNIRKHIALLGKKYQKQKKQFQIKCAWDERNDTLNIMGYGLKAAIAFTKSKIIGYIKIPFLLRTVAWGYKDRLIKEVLKELNAFLKKI